MAMRLPLADGSLVLDASSGWCTVWLEANGDRLGLGGDDAAIIRQRLLSHLTAPRQACGEVDGRPVYWVLSLSERLCTLYAEFGPDGRRLLIQGPQCEWLYRGALSDPQWEAWQAILTGHDDRAST
jgi:hypothetical protein